MGVVREIVGDVRLVLLRIVRDFQTHLGGYSFRTTNIAQVLLEALVTRHPEALVPKFTMVHP